MPILRMNSTRRGHDRKMLDVPARSEGANALAFPNAVAKQASAVGLAPSIYGFGLAARVLAVTIGFVLLAMSLFYVTRLTAHREMWLHGKISWAQTTVEAFDLAGPNPPSADLSRKILNGVAVKSIVVTTPKERREFILPGVEPDKAEPVATDGVSFLDSVA